MARKDLTLERVRGQVKEVRDFYYHLMTYVLVSAMMIIIDLRNGSDGGFLGLHFAHWVIIGWGFGVAGHAISVFFGERKVQQLYELEKERQLSGD